MIAETVVSGIEQQLNSLALHGEADEAARRIIEICLHWRISHGMGVKEAAKHLRGLVIATDVLSRVIL